MKIQRNTLNEIFRFGITGGLATVVQIVIYWVLVNFEYTGRNVAMPVSYIISFCFNYVMSARFTFRKKASKRNGVGFALAHTFNFFLQWGLVNFFTWAGVAEQWAIVPSLCITIPVNFMLVRFAFKL